MRVGSVIPGPVHLVFYFKVFSGLSRAPAALATAWENGLISLFSSFEQGSASFSGAISAFSGPGSAWGMGSFSYFQILNGICKILCGVLNAQGPQEWVYGAPLAFR
jgi:hypothetical protein